jgi:hypothetical protein
MNRPKSGRHETALKDFSDKANGCIEIFQFRLIVMAN